MIYIILISYLAFTFWGSLLGVKTKNDNPESYFLADRSLTTLALFFTILATNFSAFYFLGFAGAGYRSGFSYYFIMAFGTALAAVSIYLIGTKVWQLGKDHGFITPAELIGHQTNSKGLRFLFSSVMIIYTLPYLALQIVGGGYILERLTEGQIAYIPATILLTLFTIAYVLVGGMASVAKTDLKQGLLAVVFMLVAFVFVAYDLGGFEVANQKLFEIQPDLFSIEGKGGTYTPQKWFSFVVFWFFCIPMFPQLFMRFYIAKEVRHLKKSTLLYGAIPLVISLFPVVIGAWGHLSFPGLEGKAADQIIPMMLLKHNSQWFAALIMTGAIAAFMSTLDSQLLALSTMATRDFYLPLTGKKVSFQKEVFIGKMFVAGFALIGLLIAFRPFDTIFDMGKLAFAGLAILFPTAFAVVRMGGVKPAYAIISIVVGQFLLVGFYYDYLPDSWLFGFESFILILLVCFVIVLFGLKRKKGERKLSDR